MLMFAYNEYHFDVWSWHFCIFNVCSQQLSAVSKRMARSQTLIEEAKKKYAAAEQLCQDDNSKVSVSDLFLLSQCFFFFYNISSGICLY